MKTLILTLIVTGAGFQNWAIAQTPLADLPACLPRLNAIRTSSPDQKETAISEALRIEQNAPCFAQVVLRSSLAQRRGFVNFFKDLEKLRTDKQAGASSGTGGTTSLVSKGVTARAIAIAAEHGALTESVNNEIVTVSGSLDGFAAALARQNLIEYCPTGVGLKACFSRGGFNFLGRFSYSISFDTGRNTESLTGVASGSPAGTAQPVTFTANRRQISAWSGRFILWNRRDAASDVFRDKWEAALKAGAGTPAAAANPVSARLKAAGEDLLKSFKDFMKEIKFDQSKYNAAFSAAFADLKKPETNLEMRWSQWTEEVMKLIAESDPAPVEAAVDLLQSRQAYQLAEDELVSSIANKPVLTLEYNNNRPVAQEPTSAFRLIFDKGLGKKWSLTANGAFTIYDQRPQVAGVDRLRSAQLGVQAQRDLGSLAFAGAAALSATYYFQHQYSPAVLNVTPGTPLPGISFVGLPEAATKVFAEKGDLHVGQVRLVLSPGKSSARFPLAVSYSNRTELIAKPTWRAQVGISYDFDALFAK